MKLPNYRGFTGQGPVDILRLVGISVIFYEAPLVDLRLHSNCTISQASAKGEEPKGAHIQLF